ncbi:unnamed protein product [Closterium sp. NIES-54]
MRKLCLWLVTVRPSVALLSLFLYLSTLACILFCSCASIPLTATSCVTPPSLPFPPLPSPPLPSSPTPAPLKGVQVLQRCWSPETPCHACCPRCFNCLLLSRHQLSTRGGEGRGGQHRHSLTPLPCGRAGGSGGRGGGQHSTRLGREGRLSGLGRLKQGRSHWSSSGGGHGVHQQQLLSTQPTRS